MNKQPEVTAVTRQKLIDAFWSLYEFRRIEKVSIKEITDRAGYNRGTFYIHFKDVYDLLEQLELSILPTDEELELEISLIKQGSSHPFEKLLELYNNNAKYYNVLLSENGDPYFHNIMKQKCKKLLTDYLKRYDLFDESIEAEYALEYTISAMLGIIIYWFQRNKHITVEKLLDIMHKIIKTSPLNLLFKEE
ncbi:TetR/AcrR family transcriptional regulator [Acetivibrio cellulolyticus]|uniref:TetR/AcrR family transcriptional regulator n=1 Tax=Acetivibrio cellulolyticus TaxID=35830 RepID=UPI0001E2CCB0|nr:TetR/AcrR family transcriptional regulator [Acetivibrio cellulolyticus]